MEPKKKSVKKKESVVQNVIDYLTSAMIRKELKPGDKLPPEPELAEQLGVGRSSVREAIKILGYCGVLESRRSEGTIVCRGFTESMIDPMIYGIILDEDDSFTNLMELREMTEAGIMRLAILKYQEEDGILLEKILSEMKTIISHGQSDEVVDGFFEIDNRFHDAIAELGRNPMADKISRVVRTLTYSMRYDTVKHMIKNGKGQELIVAHEELCAKLRSRDVDCLNETVGGTYFKDEFDQM